MCWKGTAKFRDGHTYTGSMRNGKMNGEGKFVWQDGTVYEGKFRKNEITGSGKYTWPDGTMYEGEVKDGIRNGKGKFTNPNERYEYEGEWKNGLRHGRGILRYKLEDKPEDKPEVFCGYEGEWREGEKSGHGKYVYPSGNYYEGEWLHNLRNGKGTMYWKLIASKSTNEKYVGQWKDDMQSGFGYHIWLDERSENKVLRNRYVGYWKNGLREGHGIFFYANGSMYDGQWKDNMKHGWAKFIFEDGNECEGYYERDRMVDKTGEGESKGKALTAGIQAVPDVTKAQALHKEIEKAIVVQKAAAKGESKKEVKKEPAKVLVVQKLKSETDGNPYTAMLDSADLIVLESLERPFLQRLEGGLGLPFASQIQAQGSPSRSPTHPTGRMVTKPKETQEEVNNTLLTHHTVIKHWYKYFSGVERVDIDNRREVAGTPRCRLRAGRLRVARRACAARAMA